MNYEILENEIVARLLPLASSNLSIIKLPEVEADKSKPLPTKAQITVIYAGSEYDKTTSTGQNRNAENVFITFILESTFLRGALGIYNLTRVLKLALSGFSPINCQRLEIIKHHSIGSNPIKKDNNLWEYEISFSTTALHIENFIEDVSILVKQIKLNDGDDDSIIPPI
jgi:Gp37 protein